MITIAEFLHHLRALAATVGLDDIGYVHGALATDFANASGEIPLPDLFLGRPTADGKFYYKGAPNTGVPGSANHFVKIRLKSESNTDNATGLGATVVVTAGTTSQIQLVDGGSMRGSQSSGDLMFGLNDYRDIITATVTWPSGIVQSDVPLVLDQLNIITLPAVLEVDNASVSATYTGHLPQGVNWIFEWDVNLPCDAQYDEVIFDTAVIPAQCQPRRASISEAVNGVEVVITPKPSGGFTHVMTWSNRPCVPDCTIPYLVKSGNAAQADTSDFYKTHKITICFIHQ